MATITTGTDSNGFSFAPQSCLERSPRDGSLWVIVQTGATTMSLFSSTDQGASWGTQGSFSAAGLYTIGEIRIDQDGDHIHLNYATNNGSQDQIWYKRIQINSGTADLSSGVMLVTTWANSGTAGAVLRRAGIFPYKNPNGSFAILIASAFQGPSQSGIKIYPISVKNDGVYSTYANPAIVFPTSTWQLNVNDDLSVSIDAEHNGDGITSTTPNVWCSFQIGTNAYVLKLAWQGYKTGWKSPTAATLIASGRAGTRDLPGRWDGTRFLVASYNPANLSQVDIYERNKSNTSTVKRTSPTHPAGQVASYTLSWNHITRDFRLYAVGASPVNAYYIDYIRATDTWGTWTQTSATVPITAQWGVRRSTFGDDQYDFYMQSGAGSPWTFTSLIEQVNFAPTTPTWLYGTGTVPTMNGAAFDVTSTLHLTWQFNDPNEGDTQGSYALSRQIGAAAIQYWRASDSTWQVAEVQNTSATQGVTLSTTNWLGAGGATDPAHVYKVKTWDAGGLPSSYSDGLYLIPSSRVDPTLTAPTASQILNVGQVTATWTNTEQSAFRITLTNVVSGALVYDSGYFADPGSPTPTVLSWQVPVDLPNGFSGSITLQTKNAEGLGSVVRTDAFSISFVEPVAPIFALTAVPAQGGINYSFTQAAPTGAQPAVAQVDVWRRQVVSTIPVNTNPSFEVDASDWGNSGFTSVARSTAQFHGGVASLLMTPTGAAALPFALMTTFYPLVAGSRWEMRAWVRAHTTANAVRMYLRWYDVSTTLISSTTRDLTGVADTWLWGYVSGTAPALATSVRLAVGYVGTPLATDLLYADDIQLFPANDDAGTRINANVVAGTTYLDWRATSGVNYEYRGHTTAQNATQADGPWQA